ncbi:MAG: DUF4154 domain-containing protein [Bacteroidales bacterium]|nr:DUF4154 domain-containing protein [Bacteroidales bacterium]MBN2756203.1 DUF4154 domain-containing protein [Bacteroidales bacterium]
MKAQSGSIDKQKANLLYNFPFFLKWENDDNIETIKIGVLNGKESFMKALEARTKGGYDNVIFIEVINFTSIDNITETHLLYLPKSQNSNFTKVKRKIAGYNTALVTDEYSVIKNVSINYVINNGKVTFQLNPENLRNSNIKFDQKDEGLMQIFNRLGGEVISTKTLYEDSEKSLKIEKQNVKKLQSDIKTKENELAEKEKQIKQKEAEIEKQTQYLISQSNQITDQNQKIENQRSELAQLITDATNAKVELAKKTKDLSEKEKSISEQEEKIAKQTSILNELGSDIDDRQNKIDEQNRELVKQGITIQFQKNMLLIFVVFSAIILLMSFFIWRGYRTKKKDNKLLAKQKLEIEGQAVELESINKELEKLSIVASETSSAVMILDVNGDFEWVNAGFTKMYGYTLQLLRNELDDNLIKASSHPDIKNIFNTCVKDKKPVIYESRIISREGEEKWSQTTLSPILDADKNVTKLVLIDSDITKIKEVENEIIKKNEQITLQSHELEKQNIELEKLSLVASKTENSVVIFDVNGDIEWVNDGFTRLLDISFEDFLKEYGSNLFDVTLNPNLKEQLDLAVKEKKSINYTAKTYTKLGRLLWIQTTMTPIFNTDNQLVKYVAIDADITKIKLAEEQIAIQNEKITDSILYAKKIQTAVLPPDDYLAKLLSEHFILFMPKDIVSGDFYWATHKEDKVIIAAADCTGHGVPGGFMSMLGITFLNEITGKMTKEEINPGKILTHLRNSVKESLRQTGKEGEAKDGMDIALCSIDMKTRILDFAGANNPIVIVREFDDGRKQMVDIKADDMPIGIFYDERANFKNNKIQLKKGDVCYIFSDGYADQFGGKSRRKFMLKRFKNLLLSISDKPMETQHKLLIGAFDNWKDKNKQIDDVLVIGIKIV